ncbi:MAG TPA: hypothetical protein VHH35_13580 [Pyrinomonadaceae bacterium]|nr:hypothetical protein [Pyrinomonadaceae bacterium]
MLCPRCASNQSDDVKYCTFCGANLQAVREVLAGKEPHKNSEWDEENWWTAMFQSDKVEARRLEMERRFGITPEVKRYNEIKAGVIVSSIGVALGIFLHIFMKGIASNVDPNEAEILTRIWVAGFIPFFIGLALIINGMVVSKKQAEIMEREMRRAQGQDPRKPEMDAGPAPRSLRPAETNEFIPTPFSVTDQTTRHLVNAEKEQKH